MIRAVISGTAWLAFYVCAIVLPAILFATGDVPPARTFWIELGVMIGFALLLMLALQFLTTSRFHGIGRPFGTDLILQLHRHVGILLLLFMFGHPLILLIAEPEYLEFLDPRVNAPRAIFLMLASIAMILLIVLSVWREPCGLNYEWWRLTHGLLAAGVIVVGMAHTWQVGHYVQGWGKRGMLVAIGGSALALWIYVRLWRPWKMRSRPYRIAQIRDERGDSSTVVLEPVGHSGMTFRAGQYAWMTMGDSPFSLQQNPYSFSSSEKDSPHRIEFTAKELGDFSAELVEADIGTPAYLEGPYGAFCVEDDAPGAVFIMGGIGVTPAISILRTLRDNQDPRPMLLIYGSSNWKEVAFRKELIHLEQQLNLRVVHVINEAEDDWEGETGYIDREMLERYIGESERKFSFFICGPEPMMDSVERALLALGIPLHQTRAERFNIV